ncbi:predicted protein [Arabidopsis lyrata subsp. lyrata]|uniref:Predicted protein n=1 Tax=Arabidopsis lyrata subsp. lyrata TaxID=81972 RepID=D7MGS4_ARALL|nr:predicted protein [Arabidopsis lyrata subsp. lyrata]
MYICKDLQILDLRFFFREDSAANATLIFCGDQIISNKQTNVIHDIFLELKCMIHDIFLELKCMIHDIFLRSNQWRTITNFYWSQNVFKTIYIGLPLENILRPIYLSIWPKNVL